jgi:type VI secretion system protein ImpA
LHKNPICGDAELAVFRHTNANDDRSSAEQFKKYRSNLMDQDVLNRLIAPIPGDHPCGEDISFSQEYDDVREARRQDDLSLTQGDWETELKSAQWPKVRQLCEHLLQNKSKDLQIACWYTEALCNLQGFKGLAFGLQILEILVTDFWEFFYPDLIPDDLEERAGKIEWLNKQLPTTIRNIPLTDRASGGWSWLKWDESRTVDNLGLKDAAAKERAVAEGKLTGEVFDRAASASGLPFYQKLHAEIQDAKAMLAKVEKHIDDRFGAESPGLKDLRVAVAECDDVVTRIITRLGGSTGAANVQQTTSMDGNAMSGRSGKEVASVVLAVPVGQIGNRAEAINALRQVSQFFKQNEPHSPVALLADRAAKWAEMPLERWLASVIKDDSTLSQLRELLDIQRDA